MMRQGIDEWFKLGQDSRMLPESWPAPIVNVICIADPREHRKSAHFWPKECPRIQLTLRGSETEIPKLFLC